MRVVHREKWNEPERWMSLLDDDIPLSGLTIPGTHDSAAYTYSWPFVSTQKMDIFAQLNAGIRYFDFRCGLRRNAVEMVHGPTFLGLTLEGILHVMYLWLQNHPTEALVVQIKQDRKPEDSEVHFSYAVFDLIIRDSERWRTSNTLSSLGEARGRIQLFRRFVGPPSGTNLAFGIDVTEWMDNPTSPFTICTAHGVQLTIQDHYSFPQGTSLPALIGRKGGNVRELFQRASDDRDPTHWYMNFTSAYELNILYQINPHQVAVGSYWGFHWEEGMNARIRAFLRETGKHEKRFGIVAMDFPEQGAEDLIPALISLNFKRKHRWAFNFVTLSIVLLLLAAFSCLAWWLIDAVELQRSIGWPASSTISLLRSAWRTLWQEMQPSPTTGASRELPL